MTGDDAVLDASALLALLGGEQGGAGVEPLVEGALMSTVNYAEVLQRYASVGLRIAGRQQEVEALGVELVPFSPRQAALAAAMWVDSRGAGLSLADRACLALALDNDRTAVTADRAWKRASTGARVHSIR